MAGYREFVQKQFGDDSDNLLNLYSASNDAEATVAVKNLIRDLSFGMQNFAWARSQSEQGKSKAYLYFLNRKVPIFKDSVNYGAFHTGEVTYAYNNLKFLNRPLVKADHNLALYSYSICKAGLNRNIIDCFHTMLKNYKTYSIQSIYLLFYDYIP